MQRHVLVPLAKGLQFSWLKYYGTDHSSWQPQAGCCSTCHGIYLRLQIFFIFFFSCQSKYFMYHEHIFIWFAIWNATNALFVGENHL
ncbi:hypothetical protein GQ457_01G053610 [Hibiscus cannabinus]